MGKLGDRVKEVEIIVTTVREGATASMVNRNQCKHLAEAYDEIGVFFNTLAEVDGTTDVLSLPLLDEIIRVLERGKVLVLQYGSAKWFELAVTRGVNQEAFDEVHFLLDTNMETLQKEISESSIDVDLPRFHATTLEGKQQMEQDADADHDKMLETLEEFYENLPTAIAKLKGKPGTYNRLPINMQIDWWTVRRGKKNWKGRLWVSV